MEKSCQRVTPSDDSELKHWLDAELLCPISLLRLRNPVTASDGFTYESDAIKEWLNTHSTSPMTGLELSSKDLYPNQALKNIIIGREQNTQELAQLQHEREQLTQTCNATARVVNFLQEQKHAVTKDLREALHKTRARRVNALLNQLRDCVIIAYHNYENQYKARKVGFIESWRNTATSIRQGVSNQDIGAGAKIEQMMKDNTLTPSQLLQNITAIIEHRDIADDKRVGGKSICRHLVDAIHNNSQLFNMINFLEWRGLNGLDQNKLLFTDYGYQPCRLTPNNPMRSNTNDRTIYRKFYRDYLLAVLKTWQDYDLDEVCDQQCTVTTSAEANAYKDAYQLAKKSFK